MIRRLWAQAICWLLWGHDDVLRFDGSRMHMHCTSCGYDSPGWETR